MRYKVIYTSTTLVDPYIQLPDFPRFADYRVVLIDTLGQRWITCDAGALNVSTAFLANL